MGKRRGLDKGKESFHQAKNIPKTKLPRQRKGRYRTLSFPVSKGSGKRHTEGKRPIFPSKKRWPGKAKEPFQRAKKIPKLGRPSSPKTERPRQRKGRYRTLSFPQLKPNPKSSNMKSPKVKIRRAKKPLEKRKEKKGAFKPGKSIGAMGLQQSNPLTARVLQDPPKVDVHSGSIKESRLTLPTQKILIDSHNKTKSE